MEKRSRSAFFVESQGLVAQRAEAVRRKQGADVQIRWFSAVFRGGYLL